MRDLYSHSVDEVLAQECTPEVVRRIEKGGDWQALWACLQASGFADALVPEDDGGAGLRLWDMCGVFERCGAHALPLPFGETILARALLAAAGVDAAARPTGPITFATAWRHGAGLRCDVVHGSRTAEHVIVQVDRAWKLLGVASASAVELGAPLDQALEWPSEAVQRAVSFSLPQPWSGLGVRTLQACVYSALLSGAAGRVLDMTLGYANQRVQFGRVIGKFQAVQNHLAVMSEHVAAARMASKIGCLSTDWAPDAPRAAVAKARTSEAALEVAKLGHSIHGAIGFTEEFDLQLYTRRLHGWRRAGGSETAWHEAIGHVLVGTGPDSVVDLVCGMLQPLTELAL